MARIMVAASPEPRAVIERMLGGHELSCADTLVQARQFLREGTFELIICTIAFDESKMFDLLRLVKSKPELQQTPFVAARVRPHIIRSPAVLRGVAFTCETLGAEAFLDIADYQVDPEREMREAIERLLATRSRRDAATTD